MRKNKQNAGAAPILIVALITILGAVAVVSLSGRATAARTTDAWLLADRMAEDAALSAVEEVSARLAGAAKGKSYSTFGLAASENSGRGIPMSPFLTRRLFAGTQTLNVDEVQVSWAPVTDNSIPWVMMRFEVSVRTGATRTTFASQRLAKITKTKDDKRLLEPEERDETWQRI